MSNMMSAPTKKKEYAVANAIKKSCYQQKSNKLKGEEDEN